MTDLSSLIADQWQPIETAPKDSTNILVWADGYEWPEVARYELYNNHDIEEESGEPGFWRYSDDLFADVCEIEEGELSHWMPLPPSPRGKEDGTNG